MSLLCIKGANKKMSLISVEGYKNAGAHCLKIKKSGELWINMKNVGDGLSVTNISDLVSKEIKGIYEKKELTKEEINNYKMAEKIYEKFDNFSEDELNEMGTKNVYVKNNIMRNIIKHCRGKKKRGIRAIDGFRRKLMILDFEITKCPEHEVKSKLGTIFKNEKILKEHSFKIYEIDP